MKSVMGWPFASNHPKSFQGKGVHLRAATMYKCSSDREEKPWKVKKTLKTN